MISQFFQSQIQSQFKSLSSFTLIHSINYYPTIFINQFTKFNANNLLKHFQFLIPN